MVGLPPPMTLLMNRPMIMPKSRPITAKRMATVMLTVWPPLEGAGAAGRELLLLLAGREDELLRFEELELLSAFAAGLSSSSKKKS